MTGKEIPKETIGPKVNSSKTCPNYHSQYLFLVLHTRPRMSTVFTYFPLSFSLTCSLLRSRLTTASPGQGLSRRPAPRRLSGQTGMDIITDNGKMRAVTDRGCGRHFLMIYKCIMCQYNPLCSEGENHFSACVGVRLLGQVCVDP